MHRLILDFPLRCVWIDDDDLGSVWLSQACPDGIGDTVGGEILRLEVDAVAGGPYAVEVERLDFSHRRAIGFGGRCAGNCDLHILEIWCDFGWPDILCSRELLANRLACRAFPSVPAQLAEGGRGVS